MNKNIVIIGAGISGLATAFWLARDNSNVTVLESSKEPGGTMKTVRKDGFLFEQGPNSGLETTPAIRELAEGAGIGDEMVYASTEAKIRYIMRDSKLHPLPMNPPSLIKSKLFSTKAKLRLLLEPFIGRSTDGYYQSIAEFVSRRLGQEFLDYAINPFVSGVFAGDPDKLSVASAFPKLYRLEELYGGIFKGVIKGARERKRSAETSKQSAKMFSFKNGIQSLPAAVADKLSESIIYNAEFTGIEKSGSGWKVKYSVHGETKTIDADAVITTLPAFKLKGAFSTIDQEIDTHLSDIYYPPVMVLYAGYNKSDIGRNLDGFGFLIPSKENRPYLGAIWNSVLFENRAPEDKASFSIFIGGAGNASAFNTPHQELIETALNSFAETMNITGDPVFIEHRLWEKAIPQYNLGYIEHTRFFEGFEKRNKGLFISGNFVGGISVGDCIKNSKESYEKIRNYLTEKA